MKHVWILLPLLLAAGCSKKEETPQAQPPSPAAVPASTPVRPAAPVAQALAASDHEKGTAKVEITELKRTSGGTLMLRASILNSGSDSFDWGYQFTDKAHEVKDFGGVGGIHLIDEANKKKYFVVRDAEDTCVCSRGLAAIKPGERANIWARFPQPPDDVQRISVVIPHFAPLDDVPISK